MSETIKNLMDAFAGESQANRKYLAYAKKAEKDGHPEVAKLFRAVAEAETIHALAHLKAAGKIGTTEENLKDALAGEQYEFTDMYPPMIEKANEEGNNAAVKTFTYANEVEKVHAELYTAALESLGNGEDVDYYICPLCGHTHAGQPTEACPVCGARAKAYFKSE